MSILRWRRANLHTASPKLEEKRESPGGQQNGGRERNLRELQAVGPLLRDGLQRDLLARVAVQQPRPGLLLPLHQDPLADHGLHEEPGLRRPAAGGLPAGADPVLCHPPAAPASAVRAHGPRLPGEHVRQHLLPHVHQPGPLRRHLFPDEVAAQLAPRPRQVDQRRRLAAGCGRQHPALPGHPEGRQRDRRLHAVLRQEAHLRHQPGHGGAHPAGGLRHPAGHHLGLLAVPAAGSQAQLRHPHGLRRLAQDPQHGGGQRGHLRRLLPAVPHGAAAVRRGARPGAGADAARVLPRRHRRGVPQRHLRPAGLLLRHGDLPEERRHEGLEERADVQHGQRRGQQPLAVPTAGEAGRREVQGAR
ncbi:uncharacterized protein LOC125448771 isoform X2 [Stegostoma tigrinum]|uniref:uncharacterized protein LOC125448771 isoform X2 n=1 Tax=Stegostoma tigrinum TaxID=3053191 RepID=UPI0028707884|nr:uncharacterized protein LOC125448771 isoform X2 [Stegostoma tigrinum]